MKSFCNGYFADEILRWLTCFRFHQRDHVRIHLADDPLTSAIEQFLATAYSPLIHRQGAGADLFGLIGDQKVKPIEARHIGDAAEYRFPEGVVYPDFKFRTKPGRISNREQLEGPNA